MTLKGKTIVVAGVSEEVLSGNKKFELRLADFECNTGDTLVLKEKDPKTKRLSGRTLEKKITFVLKTRPDKFYTKE